MTTPDYVEIYCAPTARELPDRLARGGAPMPRLVSPPAAAAVHVVMLPYGQAAASFVSSAEGDNTWR